MARRSARRRHPRPHAAAAHEARLSMARSAQTYPSIRRLYISTYGTDPLRSGPLRDVFGKPTGEQSQAAEVRRRLKEDARLTKKEYLARKAEYKAGKARRKAEESRTKTARRRAESERPAHEARRIPSPPERGKPTRFTRLED